MALLATTLRTAVLQRTDATRPDFAGWPATPAAAADSWAGAATAYFGELTNPALPPEPARTPMLEAAEAAFAAAALAAADGDGRLTINSLPAGFYAYTAALVPLPSYVSTPPPVPFAWPDPDDPDYPAPTADPNPFADLLSALVDVWARTGTASVPPAPPVPWS